MLLYFPFEGEILMKSNYHKNSNLNVYEAYRIMDENQYYCIRYYENLRLLEFNNYNNLTKLGYRVTIRFFFKDLYDMKIECINSGKKEFMHIEHSNENFSKIHLSFYSLGSFTNGCEISVNKKTNSYIKSFINNSGVNTFLNNIFENVGALPSSTEDYNVISNLDVSKTILEKNVKNNPEVSDFLQRISFIKTPFQRKMGKKIYGKKGR